MDVQGKKSHTDLIIFRISSGSLVIGNFWHWGGHLGDFLPQH